MLITFEGIDGAGKSTQLAALAARLRAAGRAVCVTREPGGTAMGERVREMLLAPGAPMTTAAELALLFAARAEHAAQVLRPALARGEIVLSDRFTDASEAYQEAGRGAGPGTVAALHRLLIGELWPEATVILDLDPAQALGRARRRGAGRDRIEAEGLEFLARVRQGYLAIAAREPRRCHVIAADQPPAAVEAAIARALAPLLSGPAAPGGVERDRAGR
ncbi:MAG: dTMP kinase [Terriglobales bacterium]